MQTVLILVYVFFSFHLFPLPPSTVLKFTNLYMRSSVNCYPCSHSTGLTFDLKSLLSSWKSLLFAAEKKKPTKHWGCGYRIFITFRGCIWGTDVNRQSVRSCHLRHGTWALFGINSFKGKVILAANQTDSCYKMTFLKGLFSITKLYHCCGLIRIGS